MSEPGVIRRVVKVVNERGLHARAAAAFVKLAGTFEAELTVAQGETAVSGGSIMGLMMLAAAPGTELSISGKGADAERAVAALTALVEAGFGET